jgi:hypothetical protein
MQNDRLSSLSSLAETLSVPVSSTASVSSQAPSGFQKQDLEEIRQKMDEELRQSQKSREDLELEETAWSSEDSLAAAQRFFSSAALGWGDELGLWTAAIAASQTTDKTPKEIYTEMRKTYDAQQEEFKRRQEGAALAADIAGAIVSPATYAATPLAIAGRLGQTGSLAARAATEGAVYGAGEAAESQRLEGAQTGAIGGLVGAGLVKGVTSGISKTADFVSKRRVEGDLIDDDGNFVPLTLAASDPSGAEGLIHTFYRDVVAPSFGGKGIIKKQEEEILLPKEAYINAQKEFSKNLDEGIKTKSKQVDEQLNEAKKALKDQNDNLKEIKKQQTKNKIIPLQAKLQALKTGKAEEIVAKAAADTKKMEDSRRFNFRNEAFINSFPEGATSKDIENVLEIEDIGNRARALDNLWNSKGYSMIKDKKFRFKAGELEKSLEKALQNDSYFRVNTVDIPSVMKIFNLAVQDVNFFKDPSGRIQGDLVSSLRSRVGTLANQAADPQNRRALYTLQDEIDKIMKSQLTDAQRKAFEKEAGKWKTTVVLREAIENTQVDPKKRGYFDESDWIKEVSKNNRWDSRYGTGPLNQTARILETNLSRASKSTAKRASNLGKAKARLVEKEIREHNRLLGKALEEIDASLPVKKERLSKNPQLASEISSDIKRKEQLTSEITWLEKDLAQLKELRASKNPSWYYTLAATGILAGLTTGGQLGALTAAGVAYGAGRALSTPTAQKIIAGQTPRQERIQRMLQSDKTGRTAQILGQAGGAIGSRTGMLTGQ